MSRHTREKETGKEKGERGACKGEGCVCVCVCEIPGPAERVLLSIMAAIKPETEMFEYIAI